MRKQVLFVVLSLLLAFGGMLFMLGSATQLEASVDEGAVSLGQPQGIAPTSQDVSQSTASEDVSQGLESTTAVSEFDNLVALSSPTQDEISRTYTLDADFDEGVLVNVNHDVADQLQLDDPLTTFRFIWIALSGRGTIVKVDTLTGDIKGEYRSAPDGRGKSPSRTTVDLNGNVWSGNRAEVQGGLGSAVHVALSENNQCVDRNGNGVIDTSTGLGDIKDWPNTGNADDNGGVSTAEDECIIHYVRVGSRNTRHTSVDANNNVWIGGFGSGARRFDLVDGTTGNVLDSAGPFTCGGYGGLVDSDGILWSSRGSGLLRYDPVAKTHQCISVGNSYGMAVDSQGHIWNAQWTSNTVTKVDAAGNVVATYSTGGSASRGVAITADDNVWIANSSSGTVTRLDNSGAVLATIPVGNQPTGVAVDTVGKVWVTNLGSSSAMRIDPANNSVDETVDLGAGANPYNYSDMTGLIALRHTSPQGTWTVIYDSAQAATPWGTVSWNSDEQEGSSVTVRVRSAETQVGLGSATYISVTNGMDFDVPHGRYLQIETKLRPGSDVDETSPILYDLTVQAAPPPCTLEHDKTAFPGSVYAGGAVTVTLSLKAVGECSAQTTPVDAILVLDRSGSMGGQNIVDAKQAAVDFVAQMSLPPDQVGVASFASTARLDTPLAADATAATSAINALSARGGTNIEDGLIVAARELTGANHIMNNAPLIIILSDGHHNGSSPGELQATADSIKSQGIRIISIGLGSGANAGQLQDIASSATDYYFAPTPAALAGIYQQIAATVRVAGRDMVLTDTLSSFVNLIPGTFQGPISPTVSGDQIIWNIAAVPVAPTTLTYQVAMTSTAGVWPTNESAIATYLDSRGNDANLVFPIPQVVVPLFCGEPGLEQIDPMWACEETETAVELFGSGFFNLSPGMMAALGLTGTWSFDAAIGQQALTINDYTGDHVNAILPGVPGLTEGTYDVNVVNTCVLTEVVETDPYTDTLPPPIVLPEPEIYTATLVDGFTVYGAPEVLAVSPSEGYGDVRSEVTICGTGFTPGAMVSIEVNGQKIPLEDQAVYGDTCMTGTIPEGLDPGEYPIHVDGACGRGTGSYTVLSPTLNNDLWSEDDNLTQGPAYCAPITHDLQLSLKVNRRGGRQPVSVDVDFYEGDPSSPDGALLIGRGNIPLISPRIGPNDRINGFNTSFVDWTPSQGPGEYVIYAVIDPDNTVEEDIETNNVVKRTIQVLPGGPGVDQVAPRVDVLTINGVVSPTTVYDQQVELHVESEDLAQADVLTTGVTHQLFVEYLFHESALVWTPVQSTDWMTFTEDTTWDLHPSGGLRFIQAWTVDKEGNISRFANQKSVNYSPPCAPVARDGAKVYRQHLEVGEILNVEISACEGDPDLYIWAPGTERGEPPWVSNQPGDVPETIRFQATEAGEYQVEVYGFTRAEYSISIEVEPNGGRYALGTYPVVEHRNGSKDLPQDPTVPTDNSPDPSFMRVAPPPVDIQSTPVPDEGFLLYLPTIIR
ncbi:MAG: VWA domain-containing protein [Ardenticatenaceae bacterium]